MRRRLERVAGREAVIRTARRIQHHFAGVANSGKFVIERNDTIVHRHRIINHSVCLVAIDVLLKGTQVPYISVPLQEIGHFKIIFPLLSEGVVFKDINGIDGIVGGVLNQVLAN